jgi:hypothetical protein
MSEVSLTPEYLNEQKLRVVRAVNLQLYGSASAWPATLVAEPEREAGGKRKD